MLYTASKERKEPQPSDEELKLSGYWTKARLILQGKGAMLKRIRELMMGFRDYNCPNCGRRLPSQNLLWNAKTVIG